VRIAPTLFGLFLALCCAAAFAPVKFTTLERGQQSNIDEPREAVVRSAAEWTQVWREHAGDRPKPAVDFASSIVIGVFLGTRPTGGYGVEITGVEKDGTDLIVTYREEKPARDAMLSQALTMPSHIVQIERHTGPVKFRKK
jgi:protease stability complex PrcB-like protein